MLFTLQGFIYQNFTEIEIYFTVNTAIDIKIISKIFKQIYAHESSFAIFATIFSMSSFTENSTTISAYFL